MNSHSNIPQGYKQTELGIIPEDWEVVKLGDLGVTYTGLSGKKKGDFGWGSAKYIPFLNILNNPQIDIDDLEYVNIKSNEVQNAVQNGDLFFNTSSETPEEVGMCSVLTDKIENTYLNSFCFGYRLFDNNGAIGIFLSYYFRSAVGRALMSVLAQGATRYNLAKTTFLESIIALPPIEEQRWIAEALSDVDALIAALDKKITKKRLIKRGAMQQLLTGKKRLPGFTDEWATKKLREIVDVYKGEQLNRSLLFDNAIGYPVMNGGIVPSGYYLNSNCLGDTIIISEGGNSCGYVNYMNAPFWAGGHCYIVVPRKDIDLVFLYTMLKFKEDAMMALRTGSGLPNMQKNRLLDELSLTVPTSQSEQQAIATILSNMDKEIADLGARRDKYKLIKSGMMQKLLTGQIRLK